MLSLPFFCILLTVTTGHGSIGIVHMLLRSIPYSPTGFPARVRPSVGWITNLSPMAAAEPNKIAFQHQSSHNRSTLMDRRRRPRPHGRTGEAERKESRGHPSLPPWVRSPGGVLAHTGAAFFRTELLFLGTGPVRSRRRDGVGLQLCGPAGDRSQTMQRSMA
jgi:hypothetical protein